MGSKTSGPSRYTPERHAAIVKNLKAGAFKKHAANAAGISHNTLKDWLKRGESGEQPYAKLLAEVEQAIGQDAVSNAAVITKAARGEHSGDWKAAAWNLERKFPKLYGALSRGHDDEPETTTDKPFSPWKHTTQSEGAN